MARQAGEEPRSGLYALCGLAQSPRGQVQSHDSCIDGVALSLHPAPLNQFGYEATDGALLQVEPRAQLRL